MKSYWLFNRRIQPSRWVHVYLIDHFIHDPVLSIQCWAIYKPTTSKVLKWQDSLIVYWWALWEQLDKELVMGTVVAKPEVCKCKPHCPLGNIIRRRDPWSAMLLTPKVGTVSPVEHNESFKLCRTRRSLARSGLNIQDFNKQNQSQKCLNLGGEW
jgi:hypothetical protein